MAIQKWQVYYVLNCRHALPFPKDKFIVIACVDGGIPYGFFINSAVNKFVSARPHLLACENRILSAEHPFLSHDSWVDCQIIYDFTAKELSNLRGILSPAAITTTQNAVTRCKVLQGHFKNLILT